MTGWKACPTQPTGAVKLALQQVRTALWTALPAIFSRLMANAAARPTDLSSSPLNRCHSLERDAETPVPLSSREGAGVGRGLVKRAARCNAGQSSGEKLKRSKEANGQLRNRHLRKSRRQDLSPYPQPSGETQRAVAQA